MKSADYRYWQWQRASGVCVWCMWCVNEVNIDRFTSTAGDPINGLVPRRSHKMVAITTAL